MGGRSLFSEMRVLFFFFEFVCGVFQSLVYTFFFFSFLLISEEGQDEIG